ncbi:MAG TPA: ATP-binding protein [Anaeromyxobacteraceae bacterium]|nr:ATP-binding protein [Anaeromyxobacteraceae bacterium]
MTRKPRFDDPAAREALREKLAGLGEHSLRKSYYPALQARLAELERFRALLDQGSEAIFLLDLPTGTLIDVSESACQQLGVPRERLLGRPLAELLGPDSAQPLAAALHVEDAPGRRTVAGRLHRADGSDFPVEMTVRAVTLGESRHAVVVARDTTERDRLMARLALTDRLASLGTLAAGVAHEVNNPLAFVVGNLDYLRAGVEQLRALVTGGDPAAADLRGVLAEMDSALSDAAEGADRVRRIVRDLKVFSRPEEDLRVPLDVRRVVDGALRLAATEIRHRARLVRRYEEVPRVLANEGRLSQVFTNLLVNAAQAITEGDAGNNEITVSTWTEGRRAVIEVRDTGGGIPADVLPRVFDPFFTTKPVGVGSGLGLSVCHGIVEQLGGDIEVTSVPGAGTAFRVRLPATDRPLQAPAPKASPASLPPARILVIDDDPLAGTSLARILSPPHHVVTTTRARDALAWLRRGDAFDVILCNLMMPDMGGMDLYAALQADVPEQARRVVFVTAGGFTPRARQFLRDSGAPWVEKPIPMSSLYAAIAAAAGRPPGR